MEKRVKVSIGKRTYQMTRKEWEKAIVPIAKEQVLFGIYAVEKNGCIDMLHDKCTSITQLKKLKRNYKANGFKVYTNE